MILTRAATVALAAAKKRKADAETWKLPVETKRKVEHARSFKEEEEDYGEVPLMEAVKATHAAIASHWSTRDISPPIPMPSLRCAKLAHAYYERHAPEHINLLLWCESHALTDPSACAMETHLDSDLPPFAHRTSDLGYLNLVHCLSYGETSLLRSIEHLPNKTRQTIRSGTPEFFKVLFAFTSMAMIRDGYDPLADENVKSTFAPLLKASNDREARIRFKVEILKDIYNRGVALFDLSVVPTYLGYKRKWVKNKKTGVPYHTNALKLASDELRHVQRTSWDIYADKVFAQHRPGKSLVLSKEIASNVRVSRIQETMDTNNVEFLGVRNHPSLGVRSGCAKYCRNLRDLATVHLPNPFN